MENPLKPTTVFQAKETVFKALFCPKDESFIAGGLLSGKVVLWDARKGGDPTEICPLEAAHREACSAICWVHSKSNTEFYTGSYDGSIKYWDGRELNEPIQELLLDPEPTDEQSRDRTHGVTVLEFEYTIPVRYIIGSDMGHVFVGNRKGLLPTETLLANYKMFAGPVRTIERNPFFVKNFLLSGDWCAKIWAEESKGAPITLWVKKKYQIFCGTWSTARCSLFVTGDANGELDFWDLLLNQRKPIFSRRFSSPITHIKFRPDGEFLAITLDNGDVQLMELDQVMKHSTSKEKALIAALFEREQTRCKLLEGRVEEMKLKRKTLVEAEQRRTMLLEAEEAAKPIVDTNELDLNNPEHFLILIENDLEFKEALSAFKDTIYQIDKKRSNKEFVMQLTDFEMNYFEEEIGEEEEYPNQLE